jgi:16S rRNA (cytosine967-C5)-methyltransferase
MNEYIESIKVLDQVLNDHRHLDDCLPEASPLSRQICYGALRTYYYYSEVIDELLDKPLPFKHQDLWLLLLTGLYSLEHLHRPAHASVNHTVEATKFLNKSWAKGLINAVLRRYGRETIRIQQRINEGSRQAKKNHPTWLIDLIETDWPDHPEIFEANNAHAPMTLRVNLQRQTREQYLQLLEDAGLGARPGVFSDTAVMLDEAVATLKLPGFAKGLVSIQDEAPQLTPRLMNLKPGMNVLDACAAPGGKSCHILESENDLTLTALDRDRKRIHRITENLDRLSLRANVVAEELEKYEPRVKFDRILLDAPCSATGIIRRHPDIKLLRSKGDVDKLSSIQRVLLNKAFDLLNTGGELLYSTCSILRQENDQVIANFLGQDSDRELVNISHYSDF